MTTRNVLAVINPATGRTPASEIADRLRGHAAARGISLQVVMTERPGHAIDIVREHAADVDTIIAVGGDGTVSDVVTGTNFEPLAIAIIPAGSTNIIAKDLGIPLDIDAAIRIALGDGEPLAIDIANAGNTTFLHMAGAGFDAALMRDASRALKRKIGWLAYIPAALRNIRYPTFIAHLEIDGQQHSVPAKVVLLALGSAIVKPRFSVGKGVDRTDGIIDVCVYSPPGLAATVSCLVWIGLGQPEKSRWFRQYRGKTVTLDANRPVPFEVDGDPLGVLPVKIEVLQRTVQILVPKRAHSALVA